MVADVSLDDNSLDRVGDATIEGRFDDCWQRSLCEQAGVSASPVLKYLTDKFD